MLSDNLHCLTEVIHWFIWVICSVW